MAAHELSTEARRHIIESLTPTFDSMHRQTSPGAYASLIDAAITATLEQLTVSKSAEQRVAIADISYSSTEESADGIRTLTQENQHIIQEERSA